MQVTNVSIGRDGQAEVKATLWVPRKYLTGDLWRSLVAAGHSRPDGARLQHVQAVPAIGRGYRHQHSGRSPAETGSIRNHYRRDRGNRCAKGKLPIDGKGNRPGA